MLDLKTQLTSHEFRAFTPYQLYFKHVSLSAGVRQKTAAMFRSKNVEEAMNERLLQYIIFYCSADASHFVITVWNLDCCTLEHQLQW